jgi:hypothetical protein
MPGIWKSTDRSYFLIDEYRRRKHARKDFMDAGKKQPH